MRFSLVAALALAGTALAVPARTFWLLEDRDMLLTPPAAAEKRSIITEVGNAIAKLEDGLGITEVTALLDSALGGGLTKVRANEPQPRHI